MADNYLERRMEDLQRGKLSSSSAKIYRGPQKGYVRFQFPPARVLIAGISVKLILPMIRIFSKADCKVALMTEDEIHGKKYAYDEGIRLYLSPEPEKHTVATSFNNLMAAWKDVDIIIAAPEWGSLLAAEWRNHLDKNLIPRSRGGRFVIVSTMPARIDTSATSDEVKSGLQHTLLSVKDILRERDITVNALYNLSEKESAPQANADLALLLTLPTSRNIDGMIFPITE